MFDELTKDFIKRIINEINSESNKKKISEEIVKPILNQLSTITFPYVTLLFSMYIINLILIISILIIILNFTKNK